MTIGDLEREHLINWHASLLLRCCNVNERDTGREHWRRLIELIAQRSEAQVGRMESLFINDGREASRLADTHPACQPSPIHGEWRGE